jgi:uncharacterized membrane protein YccC
VLHALGSPYFRYRHAKTIHGIRVGLGMLASMVLTSGVNLPHGVWASVSFLVVIGGLQHHGNIRKKAGERAIGTIIGAGCGLSLIIVQSIFGSLALFFVLMSAITGACAYYAIGKAGYVALLTAITMVIVSGHGDLPFDVGLWRTANVMIGIVIALAFSFVLPQYATYSWRYRLADNLRECARLYGAVLDGRAMLAEETARRFFAMSQRLVQSRALMDSVAKEIDVPTSRLEEVQRLHRSILAALEMMVTSMPEDGMNPAFDCSARDRAVRHDLLLMARALRFGHVVLLHRAPGVQCLDDGVEASPNEEGMHWLVMRFGEQVEQLRLRLAELERQWNIEGAQPLGR